MSRSRVVLAGLLIALMVAPGARADDAVLGTTTGASPIAARGGWVAWSVPVAHGWQLVAEHDGVVRTLAPAPRAQPFDVDLGTDAGGRIVATYSRCTTYATQLYGAVGPQQARGCRIRVVDLAGGAERTGGIPRAKGESDTSPSMDRGRIAFARTSRAHGTVMQVLLFTPGSRRLRVLRGGTVPQGCPYRSGCAKAVRAGSVTDLDLRGGAVTFRWVVEAPGVGGNAGYEIRTDRLGDGSSVVVGAGGSGEACAGGGSSPGAPVLDGAAVWYLQVSQDCGDAQATVIRADARSGDLSTGELPGTTQRVVEDAGALYALVAPQPAPTPGMYSPTEYRCDAPGAPCRIERVAIPALTPSDMHPQLPTFS